MNRFMTALVIIALVITAAALALLRRGPRPQEAQEPIQVLVMGAGNIVSDQAVLDALWERGLEPTLLGCPAGTGITTGTCPSSVPSHEWDGTQQNLDTFDAVVLLSNHNWDAGDFPDPGQNAIVAYVNGGRGLVTGEWLSENHKSNGQYNTIGPIIPVDRSGCPASGATTTYVKDLGNQDATITWGLPDTLESITLNTSFPTWYQMCTSPQTESTLEATAGATVYYTSSNASPGAPDLAAKGLIGNTVGMGRVISFSTLLTEVELAHAGYKWLFVNAVRWAAGRGPTN